MEKVRITFDGQEIEVEIEKMAEYKRVEGSISSSRVVEYRRVKRTKDAAEKGLSPYPSFVSVAPDPFDVLMEEEQKARIDAALDKLPPRQREAFEKVVIDGRKIVEVAKELGIDESTVRESLGGALKKLKSHLQSENPYKN